MLRKLLELYIEEVRASREAKATQDTRVTHARKFVEWVEGKFTPGQGVHPAKHEEG